MENMDFENNQVSTNNGISLDKRINLIKAIGFVFLFIVAAKVLIPRVGFSDSLIQSFQSNYGEGFAVIIREIPATLFKTIAAVAIFTALKYFVIGVFLFIKERKEAEVDENTIIDEASMAEGEKLVTAQNLVIKISYLMDFLSILAGMAVIILFTLLIYSTLAGHGEKLAFIALIFVGLLIVFIISSFVMMINKIKSI